VSKNDCVFTLSIFRVNQNYASLSVLFFNRVQAVHKPVTGFGAAGEADSLAAAANSAAFAEFCSEDERSAVSSLVSLHVKIRRKWLGMRECAGAMTVLLLCHYAWQPSGPRIGLGRNS